MEDFNIYDGIKCNELRHIPEISCYNMNYYIGLKRKGAVCNDLIYAESDDDNTTDYYINGDYIGCSLASEGDIIHVNKGLNS